MAEQTPPTADDLAPASHADPEGPEKGWAAADVDPAEYTDDDYAAQFPVVEGNQ